MSCPSGGTGVLFLGRSNTTVLWGSVLCAFYVGLRLALGSHSWGRGRGQSPDLGLGRSWRNIPQQGLGRPRESRLTHSGQRRSCPQARGGRHLVSDTGLAIVCRDLSQLYLAHRGEKERKCKKKKKSRNGKKESLKKLRIWKVQNVLLISPRELEQIWEELCNVVGSL